MNEHEIVEHTRAASISAAANVLEFIAKAKAQRRGCSAQSASKKVASRASDADFLVELTQLNAKFLNRVVALMGEHRSTAHRVLERFYAQLVPSSFGQAAEPLLFTEATQTRTIKFENRSVNVRGVQVVITWNGLQGPRPSRAIDVVFALSPGHRQDERRWRVDAPFGEQLELQVTLQKMPESVREGRVYTTELELTLENQTQRVPVTVERRAT